MSTVTSDRALGLVTAAKPLIANDEADRLHVYQDTEGIPTIGIGFNLQRPDARKLCESCGADYDALLAGTADLTPDQDNYLYQQLALDTLEWLTLILPAYFTYSLNRQIGLLSMGYNLGEPRFKGFRHMISAILQGNWQAAANEALASLWASQVKHRSYEIAALLQNG